MKDWKDYQTKTYGKTICKLLLYFLNNYKVNNCIDLGCGSGNETVYMIKRGIKVLAIDKQLNKEFILSRLEEKEKNSVSFLESNFENIELPKTDCVTAFFSIPFCNPKDFNNLWNKIYEALNENGYFVGQLFGDRDDWRDNPNINTYTIEEVKEYLKKYEILELKEIEKIRQSDNKKWHFYNIIAKKIGENKNE